MEKEGKAIVNLRWVSCLTESEISALGCAVLFSMLSICDGVQLRAVSKQLGVPD